MTSVLSAFRTNDLWLNYRQQANARLEASKLPRVTWRFRINPELFPWLLARLRLWGKT
jgi:hypothetical protein